MKNIVEFPTKLRQRENILKEREIEFNIKYHKLQREIKDLDDFKFRQRLYTILSFFGGMIMYLIFLS